MKYTQQQAKAMHGALAAVQRRLSGRDSVDDSQGVITRLVQAVEEALPEPETPIIFRMLEGECLAVMPTIPGTNDVRTCMSYAHMGQHGSCSIDISIRARLATPAEYRDLKKELEGRGYNVKVVRSIAPLHHKVRREELARTSA